MEKHAALIIDDDTEIANLLAVVLDMVGYECEITHSVKEALSSLAVSNPDLVLLDLRLGSAIGGEDILYQIRANPRLKDTQVIVITGHPSRAKKIAPLVDFILPKPIDIKQLKSIISGLDSSEPASKRDYFCDPVTGLYNKDFYYSRLEHAIERAKRRPDFIFAVCVINVRLGRFADSAPVEPTVFDTVLRDATQSLI
ncbi:MAG: response regulator, partial [Anaerolineales bacterium]|nr:response regulator [Anaerolineales bacterium]